MSEQGARTETVRSQTTSTQATTTQGTSAQGARTTGTAASQSARPSSHRAGRDVDADTEGHNGLGGVMSIVTGLLAFLAGLAIVLRTSFYPSVPGYAYRINTHAWGWVLLVLGVLLFAAGAVHLLGMAFGRYAAIAFAVLLAVGGFLTLPFVPLWSIVLIALSVVSIWGLVRDGEAARGGGGYGYDSYDERYDERSMSSQGSHRM